MRRHGQVGITWRLACLFFFEAMFLLVKKPWAIPNPFFNLHFLSRSSFKWWISIMMLSHERIELVLKTKGQLSDNYSSYHHVHVKIRNATIYNNQLLSIDGHSWSKKFCSIFSKKNPGTLCHLPTINYHSDSCDSDSDSHRAHWQVIQVLPSVSRMVLSPRC